MAIDIGIDAKTRKKVAGALEQVLTDTYALYTKTHGYHWNVEGPRFSQLHLLFETQYNELWTSLDLMAERGTYFEPNIGLVIQNYLENRARFLGVGNFTEEGFRFMEEVTPKNLAVFRAALRTPGLKVVSTNPSVARQSRTAWGRSLPQAILRSRVRPPLAPTSLSARSVAAGDARRPRLRKRVTVIGIAGSRSNRCGT